MPKGVKEKEHPPPERVRCDFCGRAFAPPVWNSRTCLKCQEKGAPDQGITPNYERVLDLWLKMDGRRKRRRKLIIVRR
jgi:hypothetical protein